MWRTTIASGIPAIDTQKNTVYTWTAPVRSPRLTQSA